MVNNAPTETDILCENCGYMLNGLPADGNCPECGSPVEVSVAERFRRLPAWEDGEDSRPGWRRFLITSTEVIFQPARFYRTHTSRGQVVHAQTFANIHIIIASLFLGLAAWMHWDWYHREIIRYQTLPNWLGAVLLVGLPIGTYFASVSILLIATRLTAWEAAYRGYRLPHSVVLRALYYHTAHFLPVALLGFVTCAGYDYLQRVGIFQLTSATAYLYVLCVEVIVGAVYLFNTYWIGMRNVMYANR
jgi:hypothetical protein